MATGIPGGNGKANGGRGYRLEYPGKVPESEVLAGTRAKLTTVATIEGDRTSSLIYGDNLPVLRSLLDDEAYGGYGTLIYIDPPFATRSRFESRKQAHAYGDHLTGADYLEFMRQRLIVMRELLAEDGSIYVHLDDRMAFPVKVLLDEIFGTQNFRNVISRKKSNPKNYTRRQYGNVIDYILFYSKSSDYVWNQALETRNVQSSTREYRYVDDATGRRYMKVPVHAPGVRNGATGGEWKGMLPPPGKHWQYTPQRLTEMDEGGEVVWSPTGNPRRKVYLDESRGVPAQDLWLDFKDAHNQMIEITGYPTEKNINLLERIVAASSNPGDIVLDAFSGSGTTAVAAESLDRRWVAIDSAPLAIKTALGRLDGGSQPMGDFVSARNGTVRSHQLKLPILRHGLRLLADEELLGQQPLDTGADPTTAASPR